MTTHDDWPAAEEALDWMDELWMWGKWSAFVFIGCVLVFGVAGYLVGRGT